MGAPGPYLRDGTGKILVGYEDSDGELHGELLAGAYPKGLRTRCQGAAKLARAGAAGGTQDTGCPRAQVDDTAQPGPESHYRAAVRPRARSGAAIMGRC